MQVHASCLWHSALWHFCLLVCIGLGCRLDLGLELVALLTCLAKDALTEMSPAPLAQRRVASLPACLHRHRLPPGSGTGTCCPPHVPCEGHTDRNEPCTSGTAPCGIFACLSASALLAAWIWNWNLLPSSRALRRTH